MAARADELTLVAHPIRWLALPAVSCRGMLSTAFATARRHFVEPTLPRMSEEWLRRYEAQEQVPDPWVY